MAHLDNGTDRLACPACNYGPFTRNNYFTGKLLVERDFTDETRFHMEKLRHHEQLLHGWGVVCGLKVKAHPNEACRDRFVCVEPGSALYLVNIPIQTSAAGDGVSRGAERPPRLKPAARPPAANWLVEESVPQPVYPQIPLAAG